VGAPVVAAYAAGQMFYFVATGDNTGAVTLNIDSLGAKAVTRDGSVALAAGDIKSGEVVVVVYDGTRFQVVSQLNSAGDARFANVSIASSLYVGGVSTFVGNAGFSANVSIASALSVGGVAAITGATTIGGNLTLSGGTANGVLYLNGSKVATSGTALTFDGTSVFSINAIGNAVASLQGSSTNNAILRFNNATTGNLSGFYGNNSKELIFEANGTTEQMRLTSTGLGIGTTSPASKLDVVGGTGIRVNEDGAGTKIIQVRSNFAGVGPAINVTTNDPLLFQTNNTERARIDSSGNVLVNTTTVLNGSIFTINAGSTWGLGIVSTLSGGVNYFAQFFNGASSVGSITANGTNTAYNTSSDYRLKDIDGPITNSGAYIDALKPVQGNWKVDGSRFIGLLAHEVQKVSETTIATGEKDGEKMQAMDYSAPELIANLIAEIQSLRARVAQLETK
jgi:hypothetical protein